MFVALKMTDDKQHTTLLFFLDMDGFPVCCHPDKVKQTDRPNALRDCSAVKI